MRNVRIAGTGAYVPERVLTNRDLELVMDTSDAWIEATYGIRERRIASPEEHVSDLSVASASLALDSSQTHPGEIGLIVHASINRDYRAPATACIVQGRLGCSGALAFDMNIGGCSNTALAISVAAKYLNPHTCKKALVICTELYSKFINWHWRDTSCFLGDGSGALVLEWCEAEKPGAEALHVDGRSFDKAFWVGEGTVTAPKSRQTPIIDGRAVWDFGHSAVPSVVREVVKRASLSLEEVDFFIFHQANSRMILDIMNILEVPASKTHINNGLYGNTGGASSLIAFDDAVSRNLIRSGDSVLLCSYGAGLAWGAVLLNMRD